jgi:hypothetical protein
VAANEGMGAFFKGALSNVLRGAGGAFVLVSRRPAPAATSPRLCARGAWTRSLLAGPAAASDGAKRSHMVAKGETHACGTAGRASSLVCCSLPPQVLYDEIKKLLNPDAQPSSE